MSDMNHGKWGCIKEKGLSILMSINFQKGLKVRLIVEGIAFFSSLFYHFRKQSPLYEVGVAIKFIRYLVLEELLWVCILLYFYKR